MKNYKNKDYIQDTKAGLDAFCREHGFLYHEHGRGHFGASPYWSFCKVENNDKVLFSIEYICQMNHLQISSCMGKFSGRIACLDDLSQLLRVMQINL
ncbi:MAG: hypothetical protein KBT39_07510 [Bacteroidales bacterium]|nr:hypothetical protein [Bacteroidales bacterium]